MGRPVVVGVDDSAASRAAVRWAAAEAARLRSPLHLVHVRPRPAPHGYRWDREVDERGLRLLALAEREVPAGVATDAELVKGRPGAVLGEWSHRAALLVLGARRAGEVTGGVVTPVVTHAACPVVVVRDGGDGPVVVGADGTAASEPAVDFAFREASLLGVPLRVVTAVADGVVARLHPCLTEQVDAGRRRHPDVPVEHVVPHDIPVRALVDAAHDARLLVVGRRDRSALAGALLGSTSRALVLHALCPLVVVPVHCGL